VRTWECETAMPLLARLPVSWQTRDMTDFRNDLQGSSPSSHSIKPSVGLSAGHDVAPSKDPALAIAHTGPQVSDVTGQFDQLRYLWDSC
jgi:hypothetical protein